MTSLRCLVAVSAAVAASASAIASIPMSPEVAVRAHAGALVQQSPQPSLLRTQADTRRTHCDTARPGPGLAASLVPIFQSRHRTSQQPPQQVSVELSSPAAAWPLHSRSLSLSLTLPLSHPRWLPHGVLSWQRALSLSHSLSRRRSQQRVACSHIWFAEGSRFHAIGFRRRHFETERRKEIRNI